MKIVLCFFLTVNIAYAQNVAINSSGNPPDASALLDLTSLDKGLLVPRVQDTNVVFNPAAEGLIIYDLSCHCLRYRTNLSWSSCFNQSPPNTTLLKSCKEIKTMNQNSTDGVYMIDIDGISTEYAPMSCYCDMTTDGGGWTLILNYLHKGGTSPVLNIKTSSLPLIGSTTLGSDESSNSLTWGHASSSLINALNFTSVRFYGKTNENPRIIHFKTSIFNGLNYCRSGSGSFSGIQTNFTLLTGHTANLPGNANSFNSNQSNNSITEYPYYAASSKHWSVGASGIRWEVDNYPNSNAFHTYHQVWVR